MALFGNPRAFIGLDIGSSYLKLVELIDRRRRREIVTYAQANLPNMLIHPAGDDDAAISQMANTISQMIDQAGVSTDAVIAAVPSSIVFSTVITLPPLPDEEINKAVHFQARDVIPADLDEVVLGWSQVGEMPHMDSDEKLAPTPPQRTTQPTATEGNIPIFVTAAPKDVIQRYTKLMELLGLELHALEVETFSAMRSLFDNPSTATGFIVDIGDKLTTFHLIDQGTPRVSHTIDFGGHDITAHLAKTLGLPKPEAEAQKVRYGLTGQAPDDIHQATQTAANRIFEQGRQILSLYESQSGHSINKTILIGGGANLKNLANVWTKIVNQPAVVGNPWRGLAYPNQLESTLQEIGPAYAVAVGLAQRGISQVQ